MGALIPLLQRGAKAALDFLYEASRVGQSRTAAGCLDDRLTAIMAAVKYIKKDGFNQHHKFKFASHDKVVAKLNAALAANGVSFGAETIKVTREATGGKDKSNNAIFWTLAEMRYTLTCVETGEARTFLWSGEAVTSDDKGLYKAQTMAKKSFLISTFLISTGDQEADTDYSASYTGASTGSGRPTARPQGSTGDPRKAVVTRLQALVPDPGGRGLDWVRVAEAVGMMQHPGDWDPAQPGFRGWSVDQLEELEAVLTELGEDPEGGVEPWR